MCSTESNFRRIHRYSGKSHLTVFEQHVHNNYDVKEELLDLIVWKHSTPLSDIIKEALGIAQKDIKQTSLLIESIVSNASNEAPAMKEQFEDSWVF